MRNRDFLAIRVAVRRTTEVESYEHDNLARPGLHLDLAQIDAAAAQVEQKLLTSVGGLKWQDHRFSIRWEVADVLVDTTLLHGEQRVSLVLGQVGLGHQTARSMSRSPSLMRSSPVMSWRSSKSRSEARVRDSNSSSSQRCLAFTASASNATTSDPGGQTIGGFCKASTGSMFTVVPFANPLRQIVHLWRVEKEAKIRSLQPTPRPRSHTIDVMAGYAVVPVDAWHDGREADEQALVTLLRVGDNHIARENNVTFGVSAGVVLDALVLVAAPFVD